MSCTVWACCLGCVQTDIRFDGNMFLPCTLGVHWSVATYKSSLWRVQTDIRFDGNTILQYTRGVPWSAATYKSRSLAAYCNRWQSLLHCHTNTQPKRRESRATTRFLPAEHSSFKAALSVTPTQENFSIQGKIKMLFVWVNRPKTNR